MTFMDPGIPEIIRQREAVHEGDSTVYVDFAMKAFDAETEEQKNAIRKEVDAAYCIHHISQQEWGRLYNILINKDPDEPIQRKPPARIDNNSPVYPSPFDVYKTF